MHRIFQAKLAFLMLASHLFLWGFQPSDEMEAVDDSYWEQAIKMSKRNGKPILFYVRASGCPPCDVFAVQRVKDDEVRAAVDKFTFVTVDNDARFGHTLGKELGQTAFPYYALLNHDKETLYRWSGYEKAYFLDMVETALQTTKPIEQQLADFNKKPTFAEAKRLGLFFLDNRENQLAYSMLSKAQAMRGADDPAFDIQLLLAKTRMVRKGQGLFTIKELYQDQDRILASENFSIEEKAKAVYYVDFTAIDIRQFEDRAAALKIGRELVSQLEQTEDNQRMVAHLKYLTRAVADGEPDEAVEAMARDNWGENWRDRDDVLTFMAWWCKEKLLLPQGFKLVEYAKEHCEYEGCKPEMDRCKMYLHWYAGQFTEALAILDQTLQRNLSETHVDYLTKVRAEILAEQQSAIQQTNAETSAKKRGMN